MAGEKTRLRNTGVGKKTLTDELAYQPQDTVLVRAPLLSVRSYLELIAPDSQSTLLDDPGTEVQSDDLCAASRLQRDERVRLALLIGSRSLFEAMERGGDTGRRGERVRSRHLRYLIRMSTRPTPYGIFAGVGLAQFGDRTDVAVRKSLPRRRTRPDMAWLTKLIASQERRDDVRIHLRVFTNPAVYLRADRFVIDERSALAEDDAPPEVSIRATRGVRQALERAREMTAFADLREDLLRTPGATMEKVGGLMSSLIDQTFLLTELRPPLTTPEPAHDVLCVLRRIDSCRQVADTLEGILTQGMRCDELEPDLALEAYRKLLIQAEELVPRAEVETPFQVDAALPLRSATLNRQVGEEVARLAELLLRITPYTDGFPSLISYREKFVARYELDREVPLFEMLDPNLGIGPYPAESLQSRETASMAARSRGLREIAAMAQRDLRAELVLDNGMLARLKVAPLNRERIPASLDINFSLASASQEQLDAGNFKIVLAPGVGAMTAGRMLGRFAHLLGECAIQSLRRCAALEDSQFSNSIAAELVYLPQRARTANVCIRPSVQAHQVLIGLPPQAGATNIPVRELFVGIRNDRFYLRWPRLGKEIRLLSGHMLNTTNAPAICRFLSDLHLDGSAHLSSFSWGDAETFPYLPRVTAGCAVIRLAEWKITTQIREAFFESGDVTRFSEELERWRQHWKVPRHVYLSSGDNRLLIDLENAHQAAELRGEISSLIDGSQVVLQEVLPGFQDNWVTGPDGPYCAEFVVSLVQRTKPPTGGLTEEAIPEPASPLLATPPQPMFPPPRVDRLKPPGSDWLFLKVYCGADLHQDLIGGPIREFANRMLKDDLASRWFIVRYSDPDVHLRLRFCCEPPDRRIHLFNAACDWGGQLIQSGFSIRFAFDTYEREIERYGGELGMIAAEQIFALDSASVADIMLLLRQTRDLDIQDIAVITTDNLLRGLGLSGSALSRWLREREIDRIRSGTEFRIRKPAIQRLYSLESNDDVPSNHSLHRILDNTRQRLQPLGAALIDLAGRGLLKRNFDQLLSHFAHLHFNRLVGTDSERERLTLGLLLRVTESMTHNRANTNKRPYE